jgi:hypothetical protein
MCICHMLLTTPIKPYSMPYVTNTYTVFKPTSPIQRPPTTPTLGRAAAAPAGTYVYYVY